MSDDNWTDMIAAERMRVDRNFEEEVAASSFTKQQWGLVMTAVEFDVEKPENPEEARLIADTSKLSSVMSEVEKLGDRGSSMSSPGTSGHPGGSGGGGVFSTITKALPFGGGSNGGSPLQNEAETLAEKYARKLQQRLEKRGRWEPVCEAASEA